MTRADLAAGVRLSGRMERVREIRIRRRGLRRKRDGKCVGTVRRNRGDMDMNVSSFRSTLDVLQGNTFRIANAIVRSSPSGREAVLQYWGTAAGLNAKRAGMRVRAKDVSTDAFVVNLFELAVRFAEPFMDAAYSKVNGGPAS